MVKRLSGADDVGFSVFDEDFGGQGFRIVVAAHHRAGADDYVVAPAVPGSGTSRLAVGTLTFDP